MPILSFNQQQSLAYQKPFLNISNNLVGNNSKSSLLNDDNIVNNNIDMDTKAKPNPNDNMTGKNYNNFYKDGLLISIETCFSKFKIR